MFQSSLCFTSTAVLLLNRKRYYGRQRKRERKKERHREKEREQGREKNEVKLK